MRMTSRAASALDLGDNVPHGGGLAVSVVWMRTRTVPFPCIRTSVSPTSLDTPMHGTSTGVPPRGARLFQKACVPAHPDEPDGSARNRRGLSPHLCTPRWKKDGDLALAITILPRMASPAAS